MAKKVKIIALLPLLAFGLPQSEGQTVSIEKKQADELIDAGYAQLYVASKGKEDLDEGLEDEGTGDDAGTGGEGAEE